MRRGSIIGYEFIVRLTIAIILVISAVVIAQRLVTVSYADKSFEGLATLMEKMKPGDVRTYMLRLDEGAAVIGFVNNAGKITYSGGQKNTAYFNRPVSCPDGKTCLCLCTKGFQLVKDDQGDGSKLVCSGDVPCHTFASFTFFSPLTKTQFISKNVPDNLDYTFYSGFIIRRQFESDNLPGVTEQITPLTIQRAGDNLFLCDHQRCTEAS